MPNGFFNGCLDEPQPQCEMEKLQTLDYCGFVNCLCYRSLVVSPGQSEPIAVPLEMPEASSENSEAFISLTRKQRKKEEGGKVCSYGPKSSCPGDPDSGGLSPLMNPLKSTS